MISITIVLPSAGIVPIYATQSWLALRFYENRVYFAILRGEPEFSLHSSSRRLSHLAWRRHLRSVCPLVVLQVHGRVVRVPRDAHDEARGEGSPSDDVAVLLHSYPPNVQVAAVDDAWSCPICFCSRSSLCDRFHSRYCR